MTHGDDQAAPSDGPDPWTAHASLLLGLILAVTLLLHARDHWLINLQEAAYGQETAAYQGAGGIQCQGAETHSVCRDTFRRSGVDRSILWLGNSQLAAVNRIRAGDRNAPTILHDAVLTRGSFVVTYQMPNANLIEHLLTIEAVLPDYRPAAIMLPVTYDDLRETGVRADVAAFLTDTPDLRARLSASGYGRAALAQMTGAAGGPADPHRDPKSIRPIVEDALVAALEERSSLWQKRAQLRGMLGFAIHTLRNRMLGINSQTKRAVSPALYRERMAMLSAHVASLRARGVDVLLYVPPYRQDVSGPYVDADYQRFKQELQGIASANGARFVDIDAIVPGPEWGMVTDNLFGFREFDFMHFTGRGHQRLAGALNQELQAMGY